MSDILAASRQDARASGLRYLGDDHPGLSRKPFRGRFRYLDADGKAVKDKPTLDRIRHLAIPPAWTAVWISPAANGHIQATGRDQRGRKQYRYHADFRAARDRTKYEHTLEFGKHIEKIRERVAADMARTGLPREKVLATIVHLLDTTLIRVGNDEYARTNGSFGLTTLRNKHVAVEGGALHFEFKGKSGKMWHLDVHDRRVARIVKSCQELPGQHLFQYLDENGERQSGRLGGRQRLPCRDHRCRADGERLPHLRRYGAGGVGAAQVQAGGECDGSEGQRPRRDRGSRRPARQYAGDLPQVLRPSGDRCGLSRWCAGLSRRQVGRARRAAFPARGGSVRVDAGKSRPSWRQQRRWQPRLVITSAFPAKAGIEVLAGQSEWPHRRPILLPGPPLSRGKRSVFSPA